jgi:carboxypeptidase C (cathepsin A)
MSRQLALVIGLAAAASAEPPAQDGYGPDALRDELKGLPGAPAVSFRMFSGYIDVSAAEEAAGTRQMFYWFVESQSRPQEDPLLLWTNGGPGCSGIGGFLSENGPFFAAEGGGRLEVNEFSWNKVANMVFIEQPVGVGFSFSKADVQYGLAQAAADNLRFVLGFLARYPLYNSSAFYLSAESYGGHYLPTLAQAIEESGQVPSFQGIFLGNPLTYEKYRSYGQYGTGWGHQLFPRPLWQAYQDMECKEAWLSHAEVVEMRSLVDAPDQNATAGTNATQAASAKAEAQERLQRLYACQKVTSQMDAILWDFDIYALDFPKCRTTQSAGRHERWTLRDMLSRAASNESVPPQPRPYEPCEEDYMTLYLNREDVRAAIGVAPGAASWTMCSSSVGLAWPAADRDRDVTPVWRQLAALGRLKIMIYSGDDDTVCPTMGTQEFIWGGLGLAPAGRDWEPWEVDGQVAGFWTDFSAPGEGSFSFVTVHGAGHMVPSTQPARSLALLERYLGVQAEPDLLV